MNQKKREFIIPEIEITTEHINLMFLNIIKILLLLPKTTIIAFKKISNRRGCVMGLETDIRAQYKTRTFLKSLTETDWIMGEVEVEMVKMVQLVEGAVARNK